jgi:hypothetical protein
MLTWSSLREGQGLGLGDSMGSRDPETRPLQLRDCRYSICVDARAYVCMVHHGSVEEEQPGVRPPGGPLLQEQLPVSDDCVLASCASSYSMSTALRAYALTPSAGSLSGVAGCDQKG